MTPTGASEGSVDPRVACPVCGAAAPPPFVSLPYAQDPMRAYLRDFYDGKFDESLVADRRFELCDCPGCGLVYQREVPDDALLAHLYGHAAAEDPDELNARRGLDVRLGYADEIESFLRHFGRPPSGVEVLDFGSGAGHWLQMAAAFGCRTWGSELGEGATDRIAAAGHSFVDLEHLPADTFDYVNTEQVVEHLVEPRETVDALAASLRPGGILRISVPNGSDIRERLRDADWTAAKGSARSLNAVAPLEHLNCFSPASLERLGRGAGLTPFSYRLRTQLHPLTRVRYGASSVLHRVRPPASTVQLFVRPG